MAGREPLGRVTAEDLDAFGRQLPVAFPEADDVFLQYGVASEVLIQPIGPQWWARAIAGSRSEPYFVKQAEDEPGRFLHLHRVMSLAAHLLECQPLVGFDAMVSDLRSRTLAGAANELAAAHRFLASGHTAEFTSGAASPVRTSTSSSMGTSR